MARLMIFLTVLFSGLAHGHPVIGISDGDTLTVLMDQKPVKVRLSDIDAPEKRQGYGERAKQVLSDLCFEKDATLDIRTTDRYGRIVARVTCAGIDVNHALVERGFAWHYVRYSRDVALAITEAHAKAAKRGLWADPAPIPPWDFRHR